MVSEDIEIVGDYEAILDELGLNEETTSEATVGDDSSSEKSVRAFTVRDVLNIKEKIGNGKVTFTFWKHRKYCYKFLQRYCENSESINEFC